MLKTLLRSTWFKNYIAQLTALGSKEPQLSYPMHSTVWGGGAFSAALKMNFFSIALTLQYHQKHTDKFVTINEVK
jgi:hypothetical protein